MLLPYWFLYNKFLLLRQTAYNQFCPRLIQSITLLCFSGQNSHSNRQNEYAYVCRHVLNVHCMPFYIWIIEPHIDKLPGFYYYCVSDHCVTFHFNKMSDKVIFQTTVRVTSGSRLHLGVSWYRISNLKRYFTKVGKTSYTHHPKDGQCKKLCIQC